MRAHYFQHVPFEGLGSIEPWLAAAGCSITSSQLYETPELPALDELDFLIVMGGPMSANDEQNYPWLAAEKRFIRDFVHANKPLLGVCLGAQLIAAALGARVYSNRTKEIGWFDVQPATSPRSQWTFPENLRVFHWHGETFDLPPGSIHVARSAACENQAFQLGRTCVGLQFHLETTPETAKALVEHCRDELVPGAFVQSEEEILNVPQEQYRAINQLMADILSFLLKRHAAT